MSRGSRRGPSSASQNRNDHVGYGGSRGLANRFRCKNRHTKSAFVELAPSVRATPHLLYIWLRSSKKYVDHVEWQTSKSSQGNLGDHISERNIKVFPYQPGVPRAKQRYVEFELTRNDHMSENAPCPTTVTVMFKDPAKQLVVQAWQILRHVCRGKELFPAKVDEWMTDALKNYTGREHEHGGGVRSLRAC